MLAMYIYVIITSNYVVVEAIYWLRIRKTVVDSKAKRNLRLK